MIGVPEILPSKKPPSATATRQIDLFLVPGETPKRETTQGPLRAWDCWGQASSQKAKVEFSPMQLLHGICAKLAVPLLSLMKHLKLPVETLDTNASEICILQDGNRQFSAAMYAPMYAARFGCPYM